MLASRHGKWPAETASDGTSGSANHRGSAGRLRDCPLDRVGRRRSTGRGAEEFHFRRPNRVASFWHAPVPPPGPAPRDRLRVCADDGVRRVRAHGDRARSQRPAARVWADAAGPRCQRILLRADRRPRGSRGAGVPFSRGERKRRIEPPTSDGPRSKRRRVLRIQPARVWSRATCGRRMRRPIPREWFGCSGPLLDRPRLRRDAARRITRPAPRLAPPESRSAPALRP